MMRKLLWWAKRCIECWDEEIELIDRETLRYYRDEDEWNGMWAALEAPIVLEGTETGVFPGLSEYLVHPL